MIRRTKCLQEGCEEPPHISKTGRSVGRCYPHYREMRELVGSKVAGRIIEKRYGINCTRKPPTDWREVLRKADQSKKG